MSQHTPSVQTSLSHIAIREHGSPFGRSGRQFIVSVVSHQNASRHSRSPAHMPSQLTASAHIRPPRHSSGVPGTQVLAPSQSAAGVNVVPTQVGSPHRSPAGRGL
jgi:hypothetical protein